MRTDIQRNRFLSEQLQKFSNNRLVIITGARQTGKTTLARATYPALRYVNLDAIEQREAVRAVRTSAWSTAIGPAILDEAQKEPGVFDKVKFAYDAGDLTQTVLLGSSQILMLQRVRETLAGRAYIFELWPLMAAEVGSAAGVETPVAPLLEQLLGPNGTADEIFSTRPNVLIGESADRSASAIEHLLAWGGMPALLPLGDEERLKWLSSYATTYLERDLGDLARLNDLTLFRQFQQLCALRSGQLLSYAELGRDAGVSPSTSRRYVEYLRLSYQAFLLPPYAPNPTSALVKTPKVYWSDLGLWRELTRSWGSATGAVFETLVVSEIFKWVTTLDRQVDLSFYRTRSGLEVDLVITTSTGVWGLEAKSARRLASADWRGLRALKEVFGEQWRGGLVVYNGLTLDQLDENIWAVPVGRLLVTP